MRLITKRKEKKSIEYNLGKINKDQVLRETLNCKSIHKKKILKIETQ